MSKLKSTKTESKNQLSMGFAQAIRGISTANPINFDAIAADAPRGKESKSLRVEKQLLSTTEALREKTNLNFSEYVEAALAYFNASFSEHLSEKERQANEPAT